jgi:hypothetical protein
MKGVGAAKLMVNHRQLPKKQNEQMRPRLVERPTGRATGRSSNYLSQSCQVSPTIAICSVSERKDKPIQRVTLDAQIKTGCVPKKAEKPDAVKTLKLEV